LVTGIDLVKLQIEVAAGGQAQDPQRSQAARPAIECRVNAENPETFRAEPRNRQDVPPSGGPGTRVDTHGYEDYVIPPYYDSLVAKLIVHDRSRQESGSAQDPLV